MQESENLLEVKAAVLRAGAIVRSKMIPDMRKYRREFARRLLAVVQERGQPFEHRGKNFMDAEADAVMAMLEPVGEASSAE